MPLLSCMIGQSIVAVPNMSEPTLNRHTKLNDSRRDWGIAEGEAVHIVGSLPALGALQQADAPRMVRMEGPHWQLEVRMAQQLDFAVS